MKLYEIMQGDMTILLPVLMVMIQEGGYLRQFIQIHTRDSKLKGYNG
jgi:anaerobic selenocysteine-containing dehydrogenase